MLQVFAGNLLVAMFLQKTVGVALPMSWMPNRLLKISRVLSRNQKCSYVFVSAEYTLTNEIGFLSMQPYFLFDNVVRRPIFAAWSGKNLLNSKSNSMANSMTNSIANSIAISLDEKTGLHYGKPTLFVRVYFKKQNKLSFVSWSAVSLLKGVLNLDWNGILAYIIVNIY